MRGWPSRETRHTEVRPASVAISMLKRSQPGAFELRGHFAPERAGLHPSGAVRDIDFDALHATGLQQDAVRERAHQRTSVVRGRLRRDAHVVLAREADRGLNVFGGLGVDDRGGVLLERDVECAAGFCVCVVVRGDHFAPDAVAEQVDVCDFLV